MEGRKAAVRTEFVAQLPRIPEEELALEEVVGKGTFSVVRKATWNRKIMVGTRNVHSIKVAVKMSRVVDIDEEEMISSDMARDLAVISGLPHQNIIALHGVCEPTKGTPMIVYELMSTDLSKLIRDSVSPSEFGSGQKLSTHMLLRVLRDVSAGLDHLHANGVIHRDVKPANVLLRDEQVKLCDLGSSKDLLHTQKMTVTGTLDYMAPELLNRQPAGRAVDVWAFGVLIFECVTGSTCAREAPMQVLKAELKRAGCLPALAEMFVDCHQAEASERPPMAVIHSRLQQLVMQDANDSQRLKEELKRAEAQDRDTYQNTWNEHYAIQPHAHELLEYVNQLQRKQPSQLVRQPLQGKGSLAELKRLASKVTSRLHARLKAIIEECGGTYLSAATKSHARCVQKVEQEYDGDYSKLLDLERATGLFEQTTDMLRCLQRVQGGQSHKAASGEVQVLRSKDRLNHPLASGYRDILLNVCDVQSGFVAELQLNFHQIAHIKSQTHRFYELARVMELQWASQGTEQAALQDIETKAVETKVETSLEPGVSKQCFRCGTRFKRFQWKHSCKACGHTVCGNCRPDSRRICIFCIRDKNRRFMLDEMIREEIKQDGNTNKALLFGTRGSGTATMLEPLMATHGSNFRAFVPDIHSSIVRAAQCLINAVGSKHVSCPESVQCILQMSSEDSITPGNVEHFKALWADPEIQAASQSNSFLVDNKSAAFFFSRISVVARHDYLPTAHELMKWRAQAKGIVELDLVLQGNRVKIYDVSHMCGERKKWLSCFSGVMLMIFAVALSDYADETEPNRLEAALELFEEICKSRWFVPDVLLCLHKRDVFEETLKVVPLKVCPHFRNYDGPQTLEAGLAAIEEAFTMRATAHQKRVTTVIGCKNFGGVLFETFADIIRRTALNQAGLK